LGSRGDEDSYIVALDEVLACAASLTCLSSELLEATNQA
jgi:hypothetical protein